MIDPGEAGNFIATVFLNGSKKLNLCENLKQPAAFWERLFVWNQFGASALHRARNLGREIL